MAHEVRKEKNPMTDDPEMSEEKDPAIPTPPDGGWGWMIVFGSFMIHVIADGIAYSFGVYVEYFSEYFKASKSEVGWLASLMLGVTWGVGELFVNFMFYFTFKYLVIASSA